MSQPWHARSIEQIAAQTHSDLGRGLSAAEAAVRLVRDGRNEIRKAERASAAIIFIRQFSGLVIWVLIGAAVVSVALDERLDGAAILAIVLLNGVIGFFQEYRAEQAVAALARLTAPKARVLRDGAAVIVPAAEIVCGDLVLLAEGDVVPADARLIEAVAFRTNEAPLTGESEPVAKRVSQCPSDSPLAERTNMVFLATGVAAGTALAVVVATGMNTEVGHIAALLETASSELTPLQRRLDQVGKRLLWACLAIVLVVFGLGVLRGVNPFELFLGAVSLAVAAIPEGLPAVVTIALALGVQRMARRNALVRRLAAVETLGCVGVICTDKTGTLTVGEMTVRKIVIGARIFNVTGQGYATDGAIIADGNEATARTDPQLGDLLRAAIACNDAQLNDRAGVVSVVGDPTEGALLVAAAKAGLSRHEVASANPRLAAIPFSSDRKRMTVICRRDDETPWAFVKGAPEVILERCSRMRVANATEELSPADRARMLEASALMANDALRVLAFAERRLDSQATAGQAAENADDIERDLTLLGLVGMQDPPRAEAREAIMTCRRAGIRPVMITGDHPDTARAIAREIGILEGGQRAMVGRELDAVTDAELAEHVKSVSVYARVTAEHKLRIVRAWKANGAVVAMTGDGVNDAPALKEAAIGVAMGITGTEVAKEAADIIIADDNFASIVAAVEEGRGIYDNVVKTLAYLMGGNAAELALMLVAAMVGWPLPLLPIQLLWINLVTDGLPALALATDAIDSDVLSRPPRDPRLQIMDRSFFGLLALTGFLTAAVALIAFGWEFYVDRKLADARNAAFSALVIAELLRSFGARSSTRTIWELGLLTNLRLFAVVAASFSLQLAIHHVVWLERLFGTEPITFGQCAGWIALGTLPLLTLELRKWLLGPRRRSTAKAVTD